MPNYRKLGLPKLTGNTGTDIQNLRNAFYQQDEQLRYLFEHLDGGNFSDEFFSSINDGIARWNTDNRVELDTAGLVSEVLSAADDAFTRFEQTVQGITLTVVDSEGNETAVNLSSGKFDISFLEDQIDDAEKVATNFISMRPDGGIEVGNKSGGSWTGYRSQMLASEFNILNSAGSVLASYGAQDIYLGKNSTDAKIYFCNGEAVLKYNSDENHMEINTPDGLIIEGGAIIRREYPSPDGVYNFKSGLDAYDSHVKLLSEIYVNGNRSAGSSITLSGNIMTLDADGYIFAGASIYGYAVSSHWYDGRDNALLRSTNNGGLTSWHPIISSRGTSGTWDVGTYNNEFYFVYVSDANYEDWNADVKKYSLLNTDSFYKATKNSASISFGVGTSSRRGIYDHVNGQWLVYNHEDYAQMNSPGALYFIPYYGKSTNSNGRYFAVGVASESHGPCLRPSSNGWCTLGASGYGVKYVYATNTGIQSTSDARLKENVSDDFSKLEKLFGMLHPVMYEYKHLADDDDIRIGFIAQDVWSALETCGYDPRRFAAIHTEDVDPESDLKEYIDTDETYYLNYTEFTALNTYMIQKLMKRIEELEKRIA